MSLFFSDSVITRVYYILLLEDGLLFAFSAFLSILLRAFLSQRLCLSLSLSLSHSVITLSFILILILIPRCVTLHLRNDQPSGRGQLLSRRYCTHSVWLFSCASNTAT